MGGLKKKKKKCTFLHGPAFPTSPFCRVLRSLTFAIGNGLDPPDTITTQHSLGGMRKSTFSFRQKLTYPPSLCWSQHKPPFCSHSHSPLGEKRAFSQNTILGHFKMTKILSLFFFFSCPSGGTVVVALGLNVEDRGPYLCTQQVLEIRVLGIEFLFVCGELSLPERN